MRGPGGPRRGSPRRRACNRPRPPAGGVSAPAPNAARRGRGETATAADIDFGRKPSAPAGGQLGQQISEAADLRAPEADVCGLAREMGVYSNEFDVPRIKRRTSQRRGVLDGDSCLVGLKHLADTRPVAREVGWRLKAIKPWPQPDAHAGN